MTTNERDTRIHTLVARYQGTQDVNVLNDLLVDMAVIINANVKRHPILGWERGDVRSLVVDAIREAALRYDPRRKTLFRTWAERIIHQRCSKALRAVIGNPVQEVAFYHKGGVPKTKGVSGYREYGTPPSASGFLPLRGAYSRYKKGSPSEENLTPAHTLGDAAQSVWYGPMATVQDELDRLRSEVYFREEWLAACFLMDELALTEPEAVAELREAYHAIYNLGRTWTDEARRRNLKRQALEQRVETTLFHLRELARQRGVLGIPITNKRPRKRRAA